MEITFNTPALLFPAITLLLLAYTNRFLAIANLIRKLHDEYISGKKNKVLLQQLHNLKRRINYIRSMQALGCFSFFCCVCDYVQYLQKLGKTGGVYFCFKFIEPDGLIAYFTGGNLSQHQSIGTGTQRYRGTGKV